MLSSSSLQLVKILLAVKNLPSLSLDSQSSEVIVCFFKDNLEAEGSPEGVFSPQTK
jgi:hypothetical protein